MRELGTQSSDPPAAPEEEDKAAAGAAPVASRREAGGKAAATDQEPAEMFFLADPPSLPRWLVATILGLCVAPTILAWCGVDFRTSYTPILPTWAVRRTPVELQEAALMSVRGSFTHTVLETAACVLAFVTAILALAHFRVRRDAVTPAIGMALFAAGAVDAFHTLAADRLITATADNRDFIPFTWAISRTFNAVIPVTVLGMLLFARRFEPLSLARRSFGVVVGVSGALAAAAWFVIRWCATSPTLPQTMFPGDVITRPWDVAPLLVYVLSGLLIYPRFNRVAPSHFAQAIWLSVVADAAAQLHMAFGSAELHDHHFNVAHALKILAYATPCAGLIMDYVTTYRHAETARLAADVRAAELVRSNQELNEFAHAAAHDLRSPLRAVENLASFALEDGEGQIPQEVSEHLEAIRMRVRRMDHLLDGLLEYASAGRGEEQLEVVDVEALLEELRRTLHIPEGFEVRVEGPIPLVAALRPALVQVFGNLIGNAINHHDREAGVIRIRGVAKDEFWAELSVEDDGPGIPERYRERIFQLFQKLERRDEVEGAGLGLALVLKRVRATGGAIWIEDAKERGARFVFTWPLAAPYLGGGGGS